MNMKISLRIAAEQNIKRIHEKFMFRGLSQDTWLRLIDKEMMILKTLRVERRKNEA